MLGMRLLSEILRVRGGQLPPIWDLCRESQRVIRVKLLEFTRIK